MKNGTFSRIGILLGSIAHMMLHPVENEEQIKKSRRELHFMSGGGNPMYGERRRKFKGWQRENRKYHSKHFN